jgi:hypothetical protein
MLTCKQTDKLTSGIPIYGIIIMFFDCRTCPPVNLSSSKAALADATLVSL